MDGIKNNGGGTHLNESGDTRSVDLYVRTFALDDDLRNPIVMDNLLFIDEIICPLLPAEASILDVGCGIGRYARFLRRPSAPTAAWRYAGVDRSEEIISYSRSLCPGVEFRSSEGTCAIPYADSSWDIVMASSMLQYTCDDWRDSLREMKRVARKFIFIARLPIVRRSLSGYCHQTVRMTTGDEHHYFKIFNRREFEYAVSSLECRVVAKDYSSEIFFVDGIPEPVVCNLYLAAT